MDRDIPDKLYFRIGEVAELVGVEPHVLRYWEGEFRMRPHRSNSGQRLYRKKDISRFLKIRRLLHTEGFTIAGARKALSRGAEGNAPAPTGIEVDLDKLQEAAERLGAVRAQLVSFREELRRLDADAANR
ncbi:MAG: MerR family transcriptional regulator [Alphaproteobacteria bacterium]|nr:MerR family transcriptional regulator [Alphaproteobacteria bacterium]